MSLRNPFYSCTYLKMKCKHFLLVVLFFVCFSVLIQQIHWAVDSAQKATHFPFNILNSYNLQNISILYCHGNTRRVVKRGAQNGFGCDRWNKCWVWKKERKKKKSRRSRSDGRQRGSGWLWNWSSVTEPGLDISLFCLYRMPRAMWPGLDLNNLCPSAAWNVPYIPWRPLLLLLNFVAFWVSCSLARSLWGTYTQRAGW